MKEKLDTVREILTKAVHKNKTILIDGKPYEMGEADDKGFFMTEVDDEAKKIRFGDVFDYQPYLVFNDTITAEKLAIPFKNGEFSITDEDGMVRMFKIENRETASESSIYKYTPDQTRNMFVAKVKEIGDYWVREGKDKEDAVDGALFSTLAMIDGSNIDLPGFAVTPIHDIFEKPEHNPSADIGGCLHEAFSNKEAIAEGKQLLRQALKDFMQGACAQLNLPG